METKTVTTPAGARIAWVDNLRWTVIAMVVLVHACVTYSGQGSWFFQEKMSQDVASTLVFGIYQSFAQAFFMGLMFFLAGTLVPAGYDRKGFLRFVADRAVRLGVPSLVFMLILAPLTRMISESAGKGVDWGAFFLTYRDFILTGRFLSASGPMWFAVALLVFSILYAAARLVADAVRRPASKRPAAAPRVITGRAISIGAVCLIAIIALGAFLLRLVQPLGTSVMNMQLGYFSSYIVLFAAGLWAGRNGLLAAIPAKVGRTWLWISIAVGLPLWMAVQGFGGALSGKGHLFDGGLNWQAAAIATWEAFFCVGFSLGLLILYREREKRAPRRAGVNVSTRLTGLLKSTGFGVYTFHAPILVGASILILPLAMHPLAKALLAAGLAWAASTAFAWVVRKIPGVGRMFA
jgi:glucans biosynthesis protein C